MDSFLSSGMLDSSTASGLAKDRNGVTVANVIRKRFFMTKTISYFFLNQSQERLNRYQIRSCTNKVKYLSSF